MKKIVTILLTGFMVCSNAAYMGPVHAEEYEVEMYSDTQIDINPLYADVMTEADLNHGSNEHAISMIDEDVEYLTEKEDIAKVMREAMVAREDMVRVYYMQEEELQKGMLTKWIKWAVEETGVSNEGDYLRWHYGGSRASINGYISQGVGYYTFDIFLTYYTTAEQEKMVEETVDRIFEEKGICGENTDYENLVLIYDYMCENITYDYENFWDSTYKLKYSAYAALINQTAVCQGYANLFYYMASEAGLDARIITGIGNGGGHGWNIVKLNKLYYNVDATWDAGHYRYSYFLVGTDNFTDHYADEEYLTESFTSFYPISKHDYGVHLEHVWEEEYTVDQEPTCTEEGIKSIHCLYCEKVKEVEVIEATGHAFGTWSIVKESTTTTKGTVKRECEQCDEVETKELGLNKWRQDKTGWWYELADGSYLKDCWKDENGVRYHFNAKGYMDTGWLSLKEGWYYLGTSGEVQTGWFKVKNIWYYGDPEQNGLMSIGLKEIAGKVYYFSKSGAMLTGWQNDSGKWYYFASSGTMEFNKWVGNYWVGVDGVMAKNAWVDGGKYYVGADGVYKKGWVEADGNWCYLGTSGKLQKGWYQVGKVWYYGDLTTGAIYEEEWLNGTYYFKSGGAMVTGWYKIDGGYYFFKPDGAKVTNKWEGNYWLGEDGVMATDTWVDGERYYVDKNGVWVPNAVK